MGVRTYYDVAGYCGPNNPDIDSNPHSRARMRFQEAQAEDVETWLRATVAAGEFNQRTPFHQSPDSATMGSRFLSQMRYAFEIGQYDLSAQRTDAYWETPACPGDRPELRPALYFWPHNAGSVNPSAIFVWNFTRMGTNLRTHGWARGGFRLEGEDLFELWSAIRCLPQTPEQCAAWGIDPSQVAMAEARRYNLTILDRLRRGYDARSAHRDAVRSLQSQSTALMWSTAFSLATAVSASRASAPVGVPDEIGAAGWQLMHEE